MALSAVDSSLWPSLQALRQRMAAPALAGQAGVLAFGDPRIDAHLPGGGLPVGQLHEIGAAGIEAETGAVAGGFAASLAAALARRAGADRVLLWIASCCDLYAPGLLAYGIDPGRLILVRTRNDAETLGAMETALRSGAASAVLGEVGKLTRLAARRLQLACLHDGSTGLLLRRSPHGKTAASEATGAVTRWRVAPADGRPGQELPPPPPPSPSPPSAKLLSPPVRWRVTLQHARGGRPGAWIMEMGDAADLVRVAAVLGDDPAVPRPHQIRRAAA